MNGLPRAERLVHTCVHVSNFAKSWVIFKAFGLCDNEMRARILSGYKPWRLADQFNAFSFNPQFNSEVSVALSRTEQIEEWKCFMDRWALVTLFSNVFEVINTENMGLGIAAKYPCNSYQLSRVLHGFLEFMDLATFNRLANYRYNSLYQYRDEDDVDHYCVLFGPLSLVNSANVPTHFSNTDENGRDILWRLCYESYSVNEVIFEMNVTHRYRRFNYVEIEADEAIDDEDLLEDDVNAALQQNFNNGGMNAPPVVTLSIFHGVDFYSEARMDYDEVTWFAQGDQVFINYEI